jgi:hypothetical protein
MSHESARKEKNGRRRNGDESIRRDRDILWKTFVLSSDHPWLNARHRQRAAEMRGFHLPAVAWHGGVAAIAKLRGSRTSGDFTARKRLELKPK